MLYKVGKRILDLIGSIVGIIVFSPVMLLAAIWIKMVSPEGPILADTPKRVGKNGEKFKFFKFRSMIPNAHNWLKNHPEWYEKYKKNNYKLDAHEDPRIIKGGIFLRTYSVDEIPQFFNVLFGDMSLVGPRAYYEQELKEQTSKIPEAKKYIDELLTTKPGITGPWQIGGRSNIDFLHRVKLDAAYAKNNSLLYDLLVILKTPYVVLTKKGAK